MASCSLGGSAPMQAMLEEKEGSLNIILNLGDMQFTRRMPVDQLFIKELVNPLTAQPD